MTKLIADLGIVKAKTTKVSEKEIATSLARPSGSLRREGMLVTDPMDAESAKIVIKHQKDMQDPAPISKPFYGGASRKR